MKKLLTIITLAISAMTMMADSYRGTKFYFGDLYYEIIQDETGYAAEVIGKKTSSQSVVIPASVTYQGVNLPVKNIGQYAVMALHYATIRPEKEFKVPLNAAFQYQSSLTSVTLPNSIIHIGRWAFYRCTSLPSINIPNSVTSIGDHAFDACKSLTSITIPNSVTWIGGEAFCDCSSLTSVTIPDGVTHINSGTFKNCSSLTSITIPNSVTHIENHAFKGCSSLTSITIPSSVTSIGGDAFYGTALYNDPANWENRALYIDNCLIKVDNAYVGNFTIRANTRLIADWAFSDCSHLNIDPLFPYPSMNTNRKSLACTSVTSVTIPNGVKIIGEGAFRDCSSLTSVTIPNSVTSIGWNAFKGCSSLTSVTIPNSVTSIGWNAFEGCSSLTSVTIPNSVTSIGWNAFYGCSSLKSVTIPDGVTHIGERAFAGCDSLTSVRIPTSVIEIGEGAFPEHTKITRVEMFTYKHNGIITSFTSSITPTDSVFADAKIFSIGPLTYKTTSSTTAEVCYADKDITRVSIPTTVTNDHTTYHVTHIGREAFKYCAQLTSVTIPNSVTEIGNLAFGGCYSLTSITIPNSVKKIGSYAFIKCSALTNATIPNSLKSIGYNAFSYCSSLSSITIPNSVTSIGGAAFWGCTSLTSVTIPNSVKSIGVRAFGYCSSLTSVTIPNSVKSIGDCAFDACKSLTSVTIPNSVTHIISGTFKNCSSLTSITIPNSVTHIGDHAFKGCSSLTSITIPSSVTSIGGDAFYGTALYNDPANWENRALYIDNCLIKVDNAYVGNFTIRANTRLIADWAFSDCSHINLNSLFSGNKDHESLACTSLTSIIIPNSVTEIGKGAFQGCSSLTAITLSNSITSIGFCVFKDCKSLTSITIPNSVEKVGMEAFRGCESLISVTIPNSVTSIGQGAFCGCTSLRHITIPRRWESKGKIIFCDSFDFATIHYSETDSNNNNSSSSKGKTEEEPLIIRKVQLQEDGETYSVPAVEGQLVLMFGEDMSHEESTKILEEKGLSIISSIPELNYYLVQVPVGEEGQYFSQLNDNNLVDYVYPNAIEYFCSASAYALDDYVYTDHGRRVSKMLTGCDPKMNKANCDPLVNLEEKNVADSDGDLIRNTIDSTLASILLPLPKDSSNNQVVINMSFGPPIYNKDGKYEGVKWTDANVTETNRIDYRRSYVNGLKWDINLVKNFDDEDFVVVKSAGNRRMKQLETIIDTLISELNQEELKVFERHFLIVAAKDVTWDYSNDVSRYHKMVSKVDISDMTRQDPHWSGTSFASPRLAGYIYKLAEKYDLPATTVLKYVRSATEKATDNIVTYELIEQEIANANHFVDLGLPSGTLWKAHTEKGIYNYQNAIKKFVKGPNQLPTYDQLLELRQYCQWQATNTGYKLTGPNGNSITVSDEGEFDAGRVWSSTKAGLDEVYTIGIGGLNRTKIQSYNHNYGNLVHLVQSAEKEIEKEEENVADNIITYTSSDGDIINPSAKSFGATIVSNTYKNGKGTIVFDGPVTKIGHDAFSGCKSLTSVTIPNSVKEIGFKAFNDCFSLTSITIPNSVTLIGGNAFSGCQSLTSVSIPNSVTSIEEETFSGCSSLTSITIPNSVTWIGSEAFSFCLSLTSITIPNSVTWIGSEAFNYCWSLTSINIPNSVTEIDKGAFSDCESLTSVTIPNSVTWIGWGAFDGCSSLTYINIPNSVTAIGLGAFRGCSSLTSITVDAGNTYFDSRNNCNAIIETATNTLIAGCKTTTIPNSVTRIGSYAFQGCSSLTSITIPNSVTWIGWDAFLGCSSLTSITIPNSVTEIREEAFRDCSSLTSITIPNSVKGIREGAFRGCSSLTSVTIPNSVTSIGDWAFWDCESLTSVTIPNSVTEVSWNVFPDHAKIIRK